ncbi:hypothetical protein, partial [Thiolapillus sp.]|uniref:hypothetical protein n=1 Tax=Thiolapillus sp. TaxID=2017437 RepID=UPI003AF66193
MKIYKILSVLLEYPTQELLDHRQEIEQLLPGLEHATAEDIEALREFMAWASDLTLTEFQAH